MPGSVQVSHSQLKAVLCACLCGHVCICIMKCALVHYCVFHLVVEDSFLVRLYDSDTDELSSLDRLYVCLCDRFLVERDFGSAKVRYIYALCSRALQKRDT